jgi:Phage tail assembly chaperone proteins, E, or 41 or 14
MNKPEREGFIDAEPVEEPQEIEATKEEAAPLPPDVWPLVIKLKHKPIRETKSGPEINELSFREPTAGDIIRAGGNPVRVEVADITGNQVTYNFRIDDAKMLRLMASLARVLEPTLQQMDPRDYNSCAYRLQRFFVSEQGMW